METILPFAPSLLSLVADWVTIASFVIGIVALIFGFWQLYKTKGAAEAAEKASNQAISRISKIVAIATIDRVRSRSRDVYHLTKARNYLSAALSAFELREAIFEFTNSSAGKIALDEKTRERVQNDICELHHALERRRKQTDKIDSSDLIKKTSDIHSLFSSLSSVIGERIGEDNVAS